MYLGRGRITTVAALAGAVLAGSLVVTPAAGAAITASTITTPTDPTFLVGPFDPATSQPAGTFAISGTTSGGTAADHVDILCYWGSGPSYLPVATNVPLAADGSFSVASAPEKPLGSTSGICRLRAVPAGTTPTNPSAFAGPRVAIAGDLPSKVSGGPNDGAEFNYSLRSQQLTASFDYTSLGYCGIDDGMLDDPTLAATTETFSCDAALFRGESGTPTRSELQIDGANAYAPAQAESTSQNGAGLPQVAYTYSVAPTTGDLVIHETDPLVECADPTYPPNATTCATFVTAGVTDDRTITQDHDGHVAWISDVFTSTDGRAHTLDLLWSNSAVFHPFGGDSTQLEWELPGQSGYSLHALNDTVSLPGTAPGTILVRMHGAADADTATGQGAIVYDRPTTAATFTGVGTDSERFTVHQAGTVPAGGSTRFRVAYVQDYLAANVASLAQAAATAFLNTLTVSKSGPGSGTVTSSPAGVSCGGTCSYGFGYGTSVTLAAAPATGSSFAGWSGACSGTGICTVTTDDAAAVTASFSLVPEKLEITKGGDGKGTVTSAPAGIGCGTSCSGFFAYGSSIVLQAKAAKGSTFLGWSGACTGRKACTLSMETARLVEASFGKQCVVPRLAGKTLKAARRALRRADCSLGKVKHASSRKVRKGHVIASRPKPRRHLSHGARVRLVLSRGR